MPLLDQLRTHHPWVLNINTLTVNLLSLLLGAPFYLPEDKHCLKLVIMVRYCGPRYVSYVVLFWRLDKHSVSSLNSRSLAEDPNIWNIILSNPFLPKSSWIGTDRQSLRVPESIEVSTLSRRPEASGLLSSRPWRTPGHNNSLGNVVVTESMLCGFESWLHLFLAMRTWENSSLS